MNKKAYGRLLLNARSIFFSFLLIISHAHAQKTVGSADSLENLFDGFKAARKLSCGKRAEAIRTGRRILELYAKDE
ncbi:MAG TPA: hypothetical protein VIL74_13035 [Pyrinomonadaceae bacterium]|jgi:hypothetical protein